MDSSQLPIVAHTSMPRVLFCCSVEQQIRLLALSGRTIQHVIDHEVDRMLHYRVIVPDLIGSVAQELMGFGEALQACGTEKGWLSGRVGERMRLRGALYTYRY